MELDSAIERVLELDGVEEDVDWAHVEATARIAAPQRKLTRRFSDIQP
ncbi:MAG TPA: hypothetical protein VKG86_04635 [Terracidiphilus sp.]|nr:hypothetical protein [Terracidiphilus sp.]